MDNAERILDKLDKMDEKLDKQAELSSENQKGIELINLSLRGNGGKGLYKRMDDLEDWCEDHAKQVIETTKITREEVRAQRVKEATVMAAIIGGIVAIVTMLLTLLL